MRIGGSKDIVKALIDGSVFSKGIFMKFVEIYNNTKQFNDGAYPQQEIYIPTILKPHLKVVLPSATYFDFYHCKPKNVMHAIKTIISNPNSPYFSIKRVPRDVNDKIRKYIRTL